LIGAFVMGLTMGIVAAPCIGPFVLGLLAHVSATGDALYGFFLFFVLALGLGLPYLFLGTFSGALKSLPRSGLWMVTVRKIFGVVLIGMAIYFVAPLLGSWSRYVLIAFLLISAIYFFWVAGKTKPVQFAWALRLIGAVAVAAIFLVLPGRPRPQIPWQPYSAEALEAARREGKPVIIDTFADWCIPCKELDQRTFSDSNVRSEAERFVSLKLDLTGKDPESTSAQSRFSIIGVPTIIFLEPSGVERKDLRLEGFEKAEPFLSRMKRVSLGGSKPLAVNEKLLDDTDAAREVEGNVPIQPAPALTLKLLEGSTLELKSLEGKVVLLDFWATWCLPCISEIPTFNALKKEYASKGVEIIGVSLDEDGAAVVKPFLKEHPMDYQQVIGDAGTATAFGFDDSMLPVAILIDKQGRIRFKHVGITSKEAFAGEIERLLAE
jgi:thiol:disulfide interchange protein